MTEIHIEVEVSHLAHPVALEKSIILLLRCSRLNHILILTNMTNSCDHTRGQIREFLAVAVKACERLNTKEGTSLLFRNNFSTEKIYRPFVPPPGHRRLGPGIVGANSWSSFEELKRFCEGGE